jgi:hypothetical protein
MGPLEEEEEDDEAKRVKGENRVSPTAYKEIEQTPVVLIGVEMSTPQQSSDKLVNEKSEPKSPGRADKKNIIEDAIPQLPGKTKGNIKIEAAVPFQSPPGGGKGDDTDKIAATLVPQPPGKEKNKVKANLPLSSSGEESKKVKATIPRSSDKEKNKIQATTLVPPPLGKNDDEKRSKMLPTIDLDEPECDDDIGNSSCMSGVSLVGETSISEATGNTSNIISIASEASQH